MTSSSLKFKPVFGSRLFYGQWHYCLRASLLEVSSLRNANFDPQSIDEILDQRRRWRATMQKRWGRDALPRSEITQQVRENLHHFARFLDGTKVPYKMVISTSNVWIYTNHVDFIAQMDALGYLRYKRFTQAIIDRPLDTVLVKNPRHSFRAYLRSVKMDDAEKQRFKNFLANYHDIRISPSLKEWLDQGRFYRIMDYHFVDFSDAGWGLLLGLVRPGIIRKTMQIMAK